MEYKKECLIKTRNKIVVCKENKRKIIFINNNKRNVEKIKVDGCQIKEGKRCDYLVNFNEIQNFIELKGENIKYALKQIEITINILGISSDKKNCYIISSRSPLSATDIQNYKLLFKRKFKADLFIKNNKIEVEI